MKITITREHLLDPLTLVDKMSGKHMTQPVLQCVRIRAVKEEVHLTATNLEVGVDMGTPAQVEKEGEVAVVGSVLAGLLQSMQSGATVTLEQVGGFLEVRGPTSVSKVATQDASEFPELPKNEVDTTATLRAKDLRDGLASVAFCSSSSTIKPELASVFMHFDGGTLVTAATDSFRLAEKRVSLKKAVTLDPVLIPGRAVADVLRVLDRLRDEVICVVGQHVLTLQAPGITFTTRLVGGVFPDYTQIIPKEFRTTVTMLTFDIEQVLRKAGIFVDQFNKSTLTASPESATLAVHTESQQVGENTDQVAATVDGRACTLSFNQRYLSEAFHTISSDSVAFSFVGDGQPILITPVGDESYKYLVMPMNR